MGLKEPPRIRGFHYHLNWGMGGPEEQALLGEQMTSYKRSGGKGHLEINKLFFWKDERGP